MLQKEAGFTFPVANQLLESLEAEKQHILSGQFNSRSDRRD